MPNIVMGKVYVIKPEVRKNGVTSTYKRYVERNSCTIVPEKGLGFEGEEQPVSLLYSNPASDNPVIPPAGYDDEQITCEVYDAYGKPVDRMIIENGKERPLSFCD